MDRYIPPMHDFYFVDHLIHLKLLSADFEKESKKTLIYDGFIDLSNKNRFSQDIPVFINGKYQVTIWG